MEGLIPWEETPPSLEEAQDLVKKVTSSLSEDSKAFQEDIPPESVAQLLV